MRPFARGVLVITTVLGAASGASAEVKVERVTYFNQPNCIRLSNDAVEVIVTTAIGPRVIRYGFIGGDNLLGEVPDASVKTALGEWKPWGGHRLWTAPEDMPRSYSPDNGPVEATVTGATVRLVQPIEPQTGIVKELTVTLAETGTGVTIGHRLTNRSLWSVDVAPWALTIMNAGGTILIPQEPYASHDDALLPVRSLTMWAYTDLSDPRWSLGPKYIRLRTDTRARRLTEDRRRQQTRLGRLRQKRRSCSSSATPGTRARPTRTTASTPRPTRPAAFIELETLGPMATLPPGGSVTHEEQWSLFRGVNVGGDDAALERALAPHLATLGLK